MTMPPTGPPTGPPTDDFALRQLLDDAVSDVHPEGGTDQIRARARTSSSGRWVPLTLAAAVATVAVIGGAGWLAQREPSDTPAAEPGSPTASAPQARTPQTDPGHTATLTVFYVGDTAMGPRLFPEVRTFTGVRGTDLEAAVQGAIGTPPMDPDYLSWTPSDGLTADAELKDGRLTIDVSEVLQRPAGVSDKEAMAMLQSLVATAQMAAETKTPVEFTVNGAPVSRLLDIDTSAPVPAGSAEDTMAPVYIASPMEGASVPSGFQVEGYAATFEGNVAWSLAQGDKIVREGFTTAAQCCTLSFYTFTVTAPPGEYTLVVSDTDPSDGEGVGTSQDTKQITVN